MTPEQREEMRRRREARLAARMPRQQERAPEPTTANQWYQQQRPLDRASLRGASVIAQGTDAIPFYDEYTGVLRGAFDGMVEAGAQIAEGKPNLNALGAAAQRGYNEQTNNQRELVKWSDRAFPMQGQVARGTTAGAVPLLAARAAPAAVAGTGQQLLAPRAAQAAQQGQGFFRRLGGNALSAAQTLGRGAMVGAGYGAIDGASRGTDLNSRTAGMFDGGMVGGGGGMAVAGIGRYVVGPIMQVFSATRSQHGRERALEMLSDAIRRGRMTIDEVRQQARTLGHGDTVEEMLAEMAGTQTRNLGVAAANVAGPAKETIGNALIERGRHAGGRIRQALNRAFGVSGDDFYGYVRQLQERGRTEPGPLYDAAYGRQMPDDVYEQAIVPLLRNGTEYAAQLPAASRYARNLNRPQIARELDSVAEALEARSNQIPRLSTEALDYLDRMVGDEIGDLSAGPRQETARGAQQARSNMRGALDPATGLDEGRELSRTYRRAGGRYVDDPNGAAQQARAAASNGTDFEELMQLYGDEDPVVREAVVIGFMRGLEDMINRTNDIGGQANIVAKVVGNEMQRRKLGGMLPDAANNPAQGRRNNQLDRRLERELDMLNFSREAIGGSQTAPRQQAIADVERNQRLSTQVADLVLDVINGGQNTVRQGARMIANYGTRPSIYNDETNAALGNMLTASPGRAGTVQRRNFEGLLTDLETAGQRPMFRMGAALDTDNLAGAVGGMNASREEAARNPFVQEFDGAQAMARADVDMQILDAANSGNLRPEEVTETVSYLERLAQYAEGQDRAMIEAAIQQLQTMPPTAGVPLLPAPPTENAQPQAGQ